MVVWFEVFLLCRKWINNQREWFCYVSFLAGALSRTRLVHLNGRGDEQKQRFLNVRTAQLHELWKSEHLQSSISEDQAAIWISDYRNILKMLFLVIKTGADLEVGDNIPPFPPFPPPPPLPRYQFLTFYTKNTVKTSLEEQMPISGLPVQNCWFFSPTPSPPPPRAPPTLTFGSIRPCKLYKQGLKSS